MNKYFLIARTSFKEESKTLANTITAVFSFVVIIYIFNELLSYIYGSGVGTLINGYSLKMMLWYMIMAEILMYSVNSSKSTSSVIF